MSHPGHQPVPAQSPDPAAPSPDIAAPVPAAAQPDDRGTRWVAALLAVAAITAAILAGRAAFLGNEANDSWQRSLRAEIKRSANVLLDIRLVYGPEGDQAFAIATREVIADEMRKQVADQPAEIAQALIREARIHEEVLQQMRPAMEVATERYALADGGYDLELRLADDRATRPDILALDPDGLQLAGDRAAEHAVLVMAAAIPVGVSFLAGSLAMPYVRRRRVLLAFGWLALGLAAALAIVRELAP